MQEYSQVNSPGDVARSRIWGKKEKKRKKEKSRRVWVPWEVSEARERGGADQNGERIECETKRWENVSY